MALKRRAYTPPSEAREAVPIYGSGHEALTSRRVAAVSAEGLGASPSGAAVGADLGGSSKYSNENFEGRRGERFHVNGTCTWVSRS
ncbi:hypothetical protein DNU06_17455 [Putridiphycobacter roseus]|uniref:Uncharacterized protein n=1 Tax=Putridiphycobacter roseus TaxID=2219161 RepID=A0A2W1MWN7_9FLAO|nr:hypothetical protein DNU06_17455 [Putridiphycobacter roseus]